MLDSNVHGSEIERIHGPDGHQKYRQPDRKRKKMEGPFATEQELAIMVLVIRCRVAGWDPLYRIIISHDPR